MRQIIARAFPENLTDTLGREMREAGRRMLASASEEEKTILRIVARHTLGPGERSLEQAIDGLVDAMLGRQMSELRILVENLVETSAALVEIAPSLEAGASAVRTFGRELVARW